MWPILKTAKRAGVLEHRSAGTAVLTPPATSPCPAAAATYQTAAISTTAAVPPSAY